MAINKKLIHFKNKSNFLVQLEAGNILDTSIVFIQDSQLIYTHGQYYNCAFDLAAFDALVERINALPNTFVTGIEANEDGVSLIVTSTGNTVGTTISYTIPLATQTQPGLMSSEDKTKLDALAGLIGENGSVTIPTTEITGSAVVSALFNDKDFTRVLTGVNTNVASDGHLMYIGFDSKILSADGTVTDNNDSITIYSATSEYAGVMSAADKTKLDSIDRKGLELLIDQLVTIDVTQDPDPMGDGTYSIHPKLDNLVLDIVSNMDLGGTDVEIYETITARELVTRAHAGTLVPGKMYYCTNYLCTRLNDSGAMLSMGSNTDFNIIATAISTTDIDPNVAVIRSDSTKPAIVSCKFTVYPDRSPITKGIDAIENGYYGTITYLEDSWGNKAHYDFKHCMFERYIVSDIQADMSEDNGVAPGGIYRCMASNTNPSVLGDERRRVGSGLTIEKTLIPAILDGTWRCGNEDTPRFPFLKTNGGLNVGLQPFHANYIKAVVKPWTRYTIDGYKEYALLSCTTDNTDSKGMCVPFTTGVQMKHPLKVTVDDALSATYMPTYAFVESDGSIVDASDKIFNGYRCVTNCEIEGYENQRMSLPYLPNFVVIFPRLLNTYRILHGCKFGDVCHTTILLRGSSIGKSYSHMMYCNLRSDSRISNNIIILGTASRWYVNSINYSYINGSFTKVKFGEVVRSYIGTYMQGSEFKDIDTCILFGTEASVQYEGSNSIVSANDGEYWYNVYMNNFAMANIMGPFLYSTFMSHVNSNLFGAVYNKGLYSDSNFLDNAFIGPLMWGTTIGYHALCGVVCGGFAHTNIPAETFTSETNYVVGSHYKVYDSQGDKAFFIRGVDFLTYYSGSIRPKLSDMYNQFWGTSVQTELSGYPNGKDSNKRIVYMDDDGSFRVTTIKRLALTNTQVTTDPEWYGVRFKWGSDPEGIRTGNMNMHESLPVLSAFKACTITADGTVKYLDPTDWTKYEDGTDVPGLTLDTDASTEASFFNSITDVLNVMIEIPTFSYTTIPYADGFEIRMSDRILPGYHVFKKSYVSAYELIVGTFENDHKQAAISYKGFKPTVSTTMANFLQYARNLGSNQWSCYTYEVHKAITWCFVVECATLNSLKAVNTTDFKLGGLGNGVTTGALNSTYNYCTTGSSDTLGSGSGEVQNTFTSGSASITVNVPRYRGIENPFGSVWKNCCDVVVKGGPRQPIYSTDDYDNYGADISTKKYTGMDRTNGSLNPTANTGNYLKSIVINASGDILSADALSSSTDSLFKDYFYYAGDNKTINYCLLLGGRADAGAYAGLFYSGSHRSVGVSWTAVGSRLVYHL